MEKFLEYIYDAEKKIRVLDHLVYVTFPLLKNKRILLKSLLELKLVLVKCINSILHYDYIYRRIKLVKDPNINFKTFQEKCSFRYGISKDELVLISNLFDLVQKYNQSSMEFMRRENIVILSEDSNIEILTLEKIKEFLFLSKNILKKTKEGILR